MNQDYKESKEINRTHGKSYYFATLLLPEQKQLQTFALYSFFRIPDDLVDNRNTKEQKHKDLDNFKEEFWQVLRGQKEPKGVFVAIKQTFSEKRFNTEWAESFLKAMETDIDKNFYQNYSEVEDYMYGSAGVVGFFMAEVIGYTDPEALNIGKKLGYAMQLTNFLRDIGPDFDDLGRIYIPLDELKNFNLRTEDVAEKKFNEDFKSLMIFQARRANQMYNEVLDNLNLFHPKDKLALLVALVLYRAILTKLSKQNWNPFKKRASTSSLEKFYLLARTWILLKTGNTKLLKLTF